MADNVLSMSLDEIIKSNKQKKQTGGGGGLAGARARGGRNATGTVSRGRGRGPRVNTVRKSILNNKKRNPNLFKGTVARIPNKNQRKKFQGQGASPLKRFNFAAPSGRVNNASLGTQRRGSWKQGWKGGRGRQQNTREDIINKSGRSRNNFRYFTPGLPTQSTSPASSRQQGFRANFRARNANNNGTARQRKLKLAIDSVRKARMQLRRLQHGTGIRPVRGPGLGGSGRIRIGKFGLVTTRKSDMEERRTVMQRKIRRAQLARSSNTSFASTSPFSVSPGRRPRQDRSNFRGRGGRSPRGRQSVRFLDREESVMESNWPSSSSRRGGPGSRSGGSGMFDRFNRSSAPRERGRRSDMDSWSPPLIRVRNDWFDGNYERVPPLMEQRDSRGLNPDIQQKITRIQEQGRRNRGDEKFEPIIETSDQFRRTIVTSSAMSLSDRFRSFMN